MGNEHVKSMYLSTQAKMGKRTHVPRHVQVHTYSKEQTMGYNRSEDDQWSIHCVAMLG